MLVPHNASGIVDHHAPEGELMMTNALVAQGRGELRKACTGRLAAVGSKGTLIPTVTEISDAKDHAPERSAYRVSRTRPMGPVREH
jgi:hypothetical protein